MTRTFYRVQHRETGIGPFQLKGKCGSPAGQLGSWWHRETPASEGIPDGIFCGRWRCACRTLAELRRWFGQDILQRLVHDFGFAVVRVRSSRYIITPTQVLFDSGESTVVDEVEP